MHKRSQNGATRAIDSGDLFYRLQRLDQGLGGQQAAEACNGDFQEHAIAWRRAHCYHLRGPDSSPADDVLYAHVTKDRATLVKALLRVSWNGDDGAVTEIPR